MDMGSAKNAANEMADSARSRAKQQSSEAEASIQETYGRAAGIAKDAAASASELAGDAYDRGGQYLRASNRALSRGVGDNTLTALAVAGAIGYFLAYLVHSRH